ncbi:ubiquitin carboxyl-terminal hydrolase 35 [Coccinella septempunctata]|uniref:ubiquitin carboxyl-terminal hydrolase 35 n=1 Tax=Coccinella septempunctata TaxID=41139 RepID=UPI001D06C598|nr:ubiquitin carboxyl-terminal hydrolase 35 [Coccinella septempunctata]XP_044767161.1 ubiquitin carboxyl-terminal hydrolase 35 [Coccinella septempunctata]
MAVKQMLVEHSDSATTDARLQLLLRQHEIASRNGHRRDEICISMVIGLGTCTVPTDPTKFKKFIADLHQVEDILRQECSNFDLLYATLRALYNEISDSNKILSPAMSIVLRLIPLEMIPDAVKWILNSGYKYVSLEKALHNLCLWLTKWTYTPNLSPLVVLFMEALEEEHHANIILDVTLATIEPLFKLLIMEDFRKTVGPVVFYMLNRVQNSPEVYEKIFPHLMNTATFLERENSDDSILYLQKLVHLYSKLKQIYPDYQMAYDHLESVLDVCMCSKASRDMLSSDKPWVCELTEVNPQDVKVGLNNLGNTCYMNSVLQALYMTKFFRNNVLMFDHTEMPLLNSVQDLFVLLQCSKKFTLSPTNILHLARPAGFNVGFQHDSSEFLLHLLDIMHEQEVSQLKGKKDAPTTSDESNTLPNTIVQQSFGGRSMTVFTCGECSSHSEKIDNFRELPLCFPDEDEDMYNVKHSVSSLLDLYLQPEKLCGQNKYDCNKCGLNDGEKVTRVIQAPRRLIMTLKHFKYDSKLHKRTKLLHRVKLEEYIQLNGVGYELYAAVVHHGSNADHGHYYALAKENEQWYKFNDTIVKKLTLAEIYELKPPETPYILFYRNQQSEEPENLKKSGLPLRLQDVVQRDLTEKEEDEKSKKPYVTIYQTRQNRNNDDSMPPPGCGGGLSDAPSNMYVF